MPLVGTRLYLAVDAGPIHDDHGRLIAVVETLRDMTEQKLAQMALQSLAVKDGLTGIANRRSFDETLAAEWLRSQREQTHLSLILADVDYFKRFNDTYGHQKGDACLKAIAEAFEALAFRPADLAARYGGEEFAVILPTTHGEGAAEVAARILEAVRALDIPHNTSGVGQTVSVSIGIATIIPAAGMVSESLVAAADRALYAAKDGGRNRVIVSDSDSAG